MRSEIHGVAVGLGAGVDRLGGLAHQLVEIGLGALETLAAGIGGAGGDGHARGGVDHLARDAGLLPEPVAQEAVELADRDPGFGDLDPDVVPPIVAVGRGGPAGHRLGLQVRQAIEQLAGDDLAGQTALGQVGRD